MYLCFLFENPRFSNTFQICGQKHIETNVYLCNKKFLLVLVVYII